MTSFNVKIKYKDKTKTFRSIGEASRFAGMHIQGMRCSQINPELYYNFHRQEYWDNGTEMTGEEWAKVTTGLLTDFN